LHQGVCLRFNVQHPFSWRAGNRDGCLQSSVGLFAVSLSRDAFLFAMIVGRKVSLFASPRHTVRKPLQISPPLSPSVYGGACVRLSPLGDKMSERPYSPYRAGMRLYNH